MPVITHLETIDFTTPEGGGGWSQYPPAPSGVWQRVGPRRGVWGLMCVCTSSEEQDLSKQLPRLKAFCLYFYCLDFTAFCLFKKTVTWQCKLRFISSTATQIDSSTIDGNVEFVHSQYSCILSFQFLCPTKSSILVIILD